MTFCESTDRQQRIRDSLFAVLAQAAESTRHFVAGRAAFKVTCPTPFIRDAVEALFVDLPAVGGDVFSEISLHPDSDNPGYVSVLVGETRWSGAQRLNGALASLVTAVSRLALDADPDHLHLHCAAVASRERGLLISAPSGTGKTTLAGALVQRGWAYVSDESVAIDTTSTTVTGFPKPLMVKPGGGHLLLGLESARIPFDADLDMWWHLPAGAIASSVLTGVQPHAVVILHRLLEGQVSTAPRLERLHPADAVVALMEQTMDSERFGPDAAEALAMLAARCTCVKLRTDTLDTMTAIVDDVIAGVVEPIEVEALSNPTSSFGWAIPDDVRSIRVGDRAVVHGGKDLRIVALDEAGLTLWNAFHGRPPDWWGSDAVALPSIAGFLEQMRELGLVRHDSAGGSQ